MKRLPLILLLFSFSAILLWGGRIAYLTFALRDNVRQLSVLQTTDIKSLDIQKTAQLIRDTRSNAEALNNEASPLLFPLRTLTFIPDLAATPSLISIAANLTFAADETFSSLSPLIESPTLPKIVTLTQTNHTRLVTARAAVQRAKGERAALRSDDLIFLTQYVNQVDRLLPILDSGLTVLVAAPTLLGADEPKSFLFIAQNQDELRATGGFISGAGIITFEKGKITELKIEDAYEIDNLQVPNPAPPVPLQIYMGAQMWLFRDANWSANFPTSAKTAASLYALGRGKKVAGVIAFDQTAIKNLVGAVGSVKVPYAAEPITSKNLETFMQSAWSTDAGQTTTPEWMEHRKDFMRDLGLALMDKFINDPKSLDVTSLASTIQTTLNEKHLLLFVTDPNLTQALATHGWDGAMRYKNDYLFVVDSNVGFNKANANLQKAITYQVNLNDLSAQLKSRYSLKGSPSTPCKHEAQYGTGQYLELVNRCYWNYLRVYVPNDSKLKDGSPKPTPATMLWNKVAADGVVRQAKGEANTTEFNQFFVVQGGTTVETLIKYQLPNTVLTSDGTRTRYTLKIQKQAGAGDAAVRVQVIIPSSTQFISATPEPSARDSSTLTFDVVLKKDIEVIVIFR